MVALPWSPAPRSSRRLSTVCVVAALLPAAACFAQEAKPADEAPKITYDDQVRTIFREHCLNCHNQNQRSGGLALDTFALTMEGGSSGEVVFAGDLDSSRLWALVNHDEEPKMPPNQERIAAAKLDLIKSWIEGGALENAAAKAAKKKTSSLASSAVSGAVRPENPALPAGLWKQPVAYSERAGAVTALAASPWAPVVAVAGQRQIAFYHTDSAELLGVVPFPAGIPYVLQFSRNGDLLLAGGGRGAYAGHVLLIDVKSGRRLARIGDELDAVLAADIDDSHRFVATGGPEKLLRIYAADSGEKLHEIKKHTDWIYDVRYSPDGVLLASCDRSNGLFVWESATARPYLDLRGHTQAVTSVSWRPDSNVLASASMDGTVKLWEMVEGKNVKSWNAHGGGVERVAYTQDGRLVTAGRDGKVKLWDGDGKQLREFPGFPELATEAAVSHDGRRVIGGDWAGNLQMWDAEGGAPVAPLPPNPPTLEMVTAKAQAAFAGVSTEADKMLAELKLVQDGAAAAAEAAKVAAATAETVAAAAAAAETARVAAATQSQQAAAALEQARAALSAAQAARDAAAQESAAAAVIRDQQAAAAKAAAESLAAAEQAAKDAAAPPEQLEPARQAAQQAEAQRVAAAQAAEQKEAALQQAAAALADQQRAAQDAAAAGAAASVQEAAAAAAAQQAAAAVAAAKAAMDKAMADQAAAEQRVASLQGPAAAAVQQRDAARAALERALQDKQAFDGAAVQLAAAEAVAKQAADSAAATLAQAEAEQSPLKEQADRQAAALAEIAKQLAAVQAQYEQALAEKNKAEAELQAKAAAAAAARAQAEAAASALEDATTSRGEFGEVYGP